MAIRQCPKCRKVTGYKRCPYCDYKPTNKR